MQYLIPDDVEAYANIPSNEIIRFLNKLSAINYRLSADQNVSLPMKITNDINKLDETLSEFAQYLRERSKYQY